MSILIVVIIICVICILFFTKAGKKIRLRASGTAEEMIIKDAATPDGAKAYYNTVISKKEEEYQTANKLYTQMLGKIQTYEGQLRQLQKENMKLNLNINNCVEKNDDDGAKTYLSRQQEITDKIEIIKDTLTELRKNSDLQKENLQTLYENISELKSEKETSVLTLEAAQVTKSLKATPGVYSQEEDKMLEKVRDGVKKTKEEADGTSIAYENSIDVQKKRLDKQMKDDEVNRKLKQLKAAKKK